MKSVETLKCTISIHKTSRRARLRRSDPKCNQWLTVGYNGQCLREREQVTSNIDTFESNRNIDLEDRKKGRRWGWKRVKKKRKNVKQRARWNEGKAVQRGTQASLTGCLALSLSVVVASVWWICSHPVKGGYREKCCLSEQGGGVLRKTGLVQVDMDPMNHCDPQLIDLFGAKDQGPRPDILWGTVFFCKYFFVHYDCRESGSRCCSVLTKNKT